MKNFFWIFWTHLRYSRLLKQIYRSENLIQNLSNLFGIEFKIDWVGRVYAIFNPLVKNGVYNRDEQIFEYNDRGLDDRFLVEQKIMEMLAVASRFIRAKNLFDLLTYQIIKLDNYNNYLFIIKPITFDDFVKNFKILLILIFAVVIISTTLIYLI